MTFEYTDYRHMGIIGLLIVRGVGPSCKWPVSRKQRSDHRHRLHDDELQEHDRSYLAAEIMGLRPLPPTQRIPEFLDFSKHVDFRNLPLGFVGVWGGLNR